MILLNNRGINPEIKRDKAFLRTVERHKPRESALVPLFTFGSHELVPTMPIGGIVTRFSPMAISPSGAHAMIAPVSGVLTGIEVKEHPLLGPVNCAHISINYKLPETELIPHDRMHLRGDDIIGIARGAGIIDEYDKIPLYRKLAAYRNNRVSLLAGDAVDDIPYVSSGVKIMAENGADIATGLEMCMTAVGAERGIIYAYDLGGREMRRIKNRYGIIRVETVSGNYPIWPALEKKLTTENGFGRIGVQALYALYCAVTYGVPQTEGIITVSGDGVSNPGNYLVTCGTTVADLLGHAGVSPDASYIIFDSVMNGVLCTDLQTPLFPGIRALTVLKKRRTAPISRCIGCGKCVSSCPVDVLPYYAVRAAEKGNLDEARSFNTSACIGCGVCSAVCPAGREMTHCIRMINEGILPVEPYEWRDDE